MRKRKNFINVLGALLLASPTIFFLLDQLQIPVQGDSLTISLTLATIGGLMLAGKLLVKQKVGRSIAVLLAAVLIVVIQQGIIIWLVLPA